jgi:hypothetical protein
VSPRGPDRISNQAVRISNLPWIRG